ncbi:MAG: conjugal transfer protein TraX [Clostridiales bacterium]|nr:conjugal transfer protein TraX [Clostridiales bacterium]
MTAFALKIFASACMLVDHVGAVFPSMPIYLRWIGRVSFPIYCFLIAQGCEQTKNINKYLLRLGIFALISEIPFDSAFNQFSYGNIPISFDFISDTNVYYTLFLGAAAVSIYQRLRLKPGRLFALIPMAALIPALLISDRTNAFFLLLASLAVSTAGTLAVSLLLPDAKEGSPPPSALSSIISVIPALPALYLAELLGTDYGMFGVAFILIIYLAKTKLLRILAVFCGVAFEYGLTAISDPSLNYIMFFSFGCLACVCIALYNGKRGLKLKWPFYWFYPIHLSVLAAIWLLFFRPVLN